MKREITTKHSKFCSAQWCYGIILYNNFASLVKTMEWHWSQALFPCNLTLLFPVPIPEGPQAPYFITKLEPKEIFETMPVTLYCEVSAFPEAEITWYQVSISLTIFRNVCEQCNGLHIEFCCVMIPLLEPLSLFTSFLLDIVMIWFSASLGRQENHHH